MIDYKQIGQKIRQKRLQKSMSQDKLAEMCDVGTTHISHIETGNCIPSLKVFISILNALSVSADELLCDELIKSEPVHLTEISELLGDCTSHELMVIRNVTEALKAAMRKKA